MRLQQRSILYTQNCVCVYVHVLVHHNAIFYSYNYVYTYVYLTHARTHARTHVHTHTAYLLQTLLVEELSAVDQSVHVAEHMQITYTMYIHTYNYNYIYMYM